MANTEIERRFLVDVSKLNLDGLIPMNILQGYLPTDPASHVTRVRISETFVGALAYLTIKTRVAKGIHREFEYSIPIEDANELINSCENVLVHKTRYVLPSDQPNINFEIDVFKGPLEGLIIVEVELPRLDFEVVLPDFIGLEVTGNVALSNFRLAKYPEVAKAEVAYLLKNKL